MKRRGLSRAAGLLLLLSSFVARATEDESRAAYADLLFQEGVGLMKKDRCAEAIAKFLSTEQLDPSAATLINLGTCHARLGRLAAAWRAYREAATLAVIEKNDSLKERALQAISQLMPAVTKLRVVAPRDAAKISVTLNGQPLVIDDGFPVPLDPGENVIEAAAPGRQPWRRSVSPTEVGATIVIEVPELPAAAEPPASQTPVRLDRAESGLSAQRVTAVVLVGVGVSSIVASGILGLNAKSTYDESNRHCFNGRCNQQGHDLRVEAIDKARLATYAFGLGTAVAATGVVLWTLSPSRVRRNVELSPWLPIERSAWGISVWGSL